MYQRVGSCSLCGGDVMGERGAWWSVAPPSPDTCSLCGAVRNDDVIEMKRKPLVPHAMRQLAHTTNTTSNAAYVKFMSQVPIEPWKD
jgi:hypothetical protein